MSEYILEMKGITKQYPGVLALDKVDFNLGKGEIHALMGENGAGKSTLIKILTGAVKMNSGEMILDGETLEINNVHDANRKGISAVYQELDLIPELSICENIFLGREKIKFNFLDWRKTAKEAEEILESMDIKLNVKQKLSSISVANQQMVSIARAISIDAKVVVLDEPTSSLDTSEVQLLFKVIRNLKEKGIAVIFITHRLDEVFEVCDKMTILKDGAYVGTSDIKDITPLEAVSKMIGRAADSVIASKKRCRIGELSDQTFIKGENLNRAPKVLDQNIEIKQGEILGLAGLLGSGRTELARLLFGADKAHTGNIYIKGEKKDVDSPIDAIDNHMGFCSEDRKGEGIIPHMSIRENLTLASLDKIRDGHFVSKKKQNELVEKYVKALRIKVADLDAPITSLSGGNQQKVIVARWLCSNPELLILDEPTRGIDVGAKKEILDLVEELAEGGMTILMISSILDELVGTCDRVDVLRDGSTIGSLECDDISADRITKMIADGD